MKLEIVTKGFERSEGVNEYLKSASLNLIETFLENERDLRFRVSIDEDRHRMQSRKPHYTCDLIIKSARSRRVFKVHNSGEDFHSAVNGAYHSMRTILAKRLGRSRDYKFEYQAGA